MDFSLWNGSAELLYTFLLFKFAATAALAMSQSPSEILSVETITISKFIVVLKIHWLRFFYC